MRRPINPKLRLTKAMAERFVWYPYYAGFSERFVSDCVAQLVLPSHAVVFDPWNGSGTTTAAATEKGVLGFGLDLNPVMVVVAKARLLGSNAGASLLPLAEEIIATTKAYRQIGAREGEALHDWFTPSTSGFIRGLEKSIARTVVPYGSRDLRKADNVSTLSSLAAFYYVALFRVVRHMLATRKSSNPTWFRVPRIPSELGSTNWKALSSKFRHEVNAMCSCIENSNLFFHECEEARILVGDARSIPADVGTIDAIITSPPYCTRLDYAVATRPELAILGKGEGQGFPRLRESLTGSVVIRSMAPEPQPKWGRTCLRILARVYAHPSKASAGYYFRQFLQYFEDLSQSITELRRVSRIGAACILVIQDSLYKEIHIDLPKIISEMCYEAGFEFLNSHRYLTTNSMRYVNSRARQYSSNWRPVEVVLRLRAA